MAQYRRWVAALALAATGTAVPAQAQGHCWAEREVAAAQVRAMQTMLMVATLRCQAAHIDISADYNGFVAAQKDALERANLAIKRHFAAAGGAQSDYDRFATSLANGFGDEQTGESSCAEASALAHEAAAVAPGALEAMALARIFPTALPDGGCAAPAGGVMLAAAPVAATARPEPQPTLIALAPPPPDTAPVTLPADVVAAMTVMARFQTAPGAAAPAPVKTAAVAADDAPVMGPVQLWQVDRPTQIAGLQR